MTDKHWDALRRRRNALRDKSRTRDEGGEDMEVEDWTELEALDEILHNKQLYLAALSKGSNQNERE